MGFGSLQICSHEVQAVYRVVDTVRERNQPDDPYFRDSDLMKTEERTAIKEVKGFADFLIFLFGVSRETSQPVMLEMLFGGKCVDSVVDVPAGSVDRLIDALEVLEYEDDESLEALYKYAQRWAEDRGDDE